DLPQEAILELNQSPAGGDPRRTISQAKQSPNWGTAQFRKGGYLDELLSLPNFHSRGGAHPQTALGIPGERVDAHISQSTFGRESLNSTVVQPAQSAAGCADPKIACFVGI